MKFTIKSLNISERKGEIKLPIPEVEIDNHGITTDAHRGDWHRQVSFLAKEDIDEFAKKFKHEFKFGDFAENITTEGINFREVKILDIFENENVKLMITQKGKKCHGGGCAVFEQVGHCVMPKEGIFTQVIRPGKLKVGDVLDYKPKVFKIAVITLSDRASRGEYEDLSGPTIEKSIEEFFVSIDRKYEIEKIIIPDNATQLKDLIGNMIGKFDVIFTTGGTGMGDKDITIETVTPMLSKRVPGIMEMIRIKYAEKNPNALLSRSVAGSISKTLVFCLPGSPKAVIEYMSEIITVLEHMIYMVYGFDNH
ncbi:MAG TPA: molybdopterin-binding protein [Bacteroidales bacterium]|nr:molybdopterin-binding protein [Bacteroidales bacterium]